MTNKSTLKSTVTKLKNKIINQLHEVDIEKLVEVAKVLNIRVSPTLEKFRDDNNNN